MSGLAAHADAGRWESIWVYDHFHTVPVPSEPATHEAWSLISSFAATTTRVRLGQMCTCMSYRNPGYLAKVATTADIISGGRIEMGIGAGWYEHEWRAYGHGFPRAGERLARLDEDVQIMKQAWRAGTATLDGMHYQMHAWCHFSAAPVAAGRHPDLDRRGRREIHGRLSQRQRPRGGHPEQVVERLTAMKKRGLGYSIHYFPEAAYDRSGIELFEREVIPALS